MILASYERMNFNDFFCYRGKPSIFFAVELGAIISFVVLYLFFRPYTQRVEPIPQVRAKTWIPTYMLIGMIFMLALSPLIDPEFRFAGGVGCMLFALSGLIWYARREKGEGMQILKKYDWDTTFFLAGVFVIVGILEQVGVLEDLKDIILHVTGGHRFTNFIFLVWFSVLVSAFIDNVPYVTTMIPVAQKIGAELGGDHHLLVFGLLIGACLGGNITPIGASANIVSVGILRKNEYPISFGTFVRIGLPFTIAATSAAALFLWIVWG
jgi:Na+/H+ antiporter NhaD/arsenite permease-like protein